MQTRHPSTSSPPGSPAKTSASPDAKPDSTGTAPDCGGESATLLATYDPDSCCWRTSQQSLLPEGPRLLDRLPPWGTTRGGGLYEQPTLVPHTAGPAGSALPTPIARDWKGPSGRAANGETDDLPSALLPTPTGPAGPNQSPTPGAALRPSLHQITDLLSGDHADASTETVSGRWAGRTRTQGRQPSRRTVTRGFSESVDFGKYGGAIRQWEQLTRPAPTPPLTGRLNPRFRRMDDGFTRRMGHRPRHVPHPATQNAWQRCRTPAGRASLSVYSPKVDHPANRQ